MSELKPCPFCGGKAVLTHEFVSGSYMAVCRTCYALINRYEKQEAIEAWNARAESEEDKCNRERLVQIGEAVAKKEPIHFLAGETYVPERTCKVIELNAPIGEVHYKCSSCGSEHTTFKGELNLLEFDYCPICGAKVVE